MTTKGQDRIRREFQKFMPEDEANAMRIFKGYAVDTGLVGWHAQQFGRSNHWFLGNNIAEALETVDDMHNAHIYNADAIAADQEAGY